MNDDQLFLAHAYLDGELDDADRRAVESDPVMMTEVDRLRAVQEALIDVRPDPVRRERDIAAALVEFSARHDAAPPAYDPTPAAGAARPAPVGSSNSGMRRWLGVAAAVVALGVLGVAVVYGMSNTGGSDDSAGSASEAGPAEESFGTGDTDAQAEGARDQAGEDSADDAADSAESAATDAPTALAEQDTEAPAGTEASEGTAATDAESTLAESQAEPSAAAVAERLPDGPIIEPVELAAVGNDAVSAAEDGSLGTTPETECTVVEPDRGMTYRILTRHPVTVDETTVDAFIGYVNTDPTGYVALHPDTCDVLMDATDALLR